MHLLFSMKTSKRSSWIFFQLQNGEVSVRVRLDHCPCVLDIAILAFHHPATAHERTWAFDEPNNIRRSKPPDMSISLKLLVPPFCLDHHLLVVVNHFGKDWTTSFAELKPHAFLHHMASNHRPFYCRRPGTRQRQPQTAFPLSQFCLDPTITG